MTTKTAKPKKINAATIWIVTQQGLDMGADCADQAERLRDIFERGLERKPLNSADYLACNPVEINIRIEDIDRAVRKWTEVCGDPARVIVIRHHKPSYDRYHELYD